MKLWTVLQSLTTCLFLFDFCCSEYEKTKRVSDPLDIGSPWPANQLPDILDIPTGNLPTLETDIPGDPLGPSDFNRPIEKISMSAINIGERRDPIEMAGLFQGDIMLTARDGMEELPMISRDILLRNAVIEFDRRWTNGVIPYVISKAYDLNGRSIIAKAIKEYHNATCIRFVPRTKEKDYIHILKGDGCSSAVGRVGGAQAVALGPGCLIPGVVMHELMHATGFWHEQSRADRDNYIKIVWDNILTGMEYNFQKYNWTEIQNLGFEYDPRSIMHYGPYAFARDRQKPTIIPLSANPIGQRERLSNIDRLKINKLYECDGPNLINAIVYPPNSTHPDSFCEDFSKNCDTWAASGECDKNPLWMKSNCRKSCSECGKPCGDDHESCGQWAEAKECTENPPYMFIYCKKVCGICKVDGAASNSCSDNNEHCIKWAENGQCRINPGYMLASCKKACQQC